MAVRWAPLAFILGLAPLMMFGGIGAQFRSQQAVGVATALGAASFSLYAVHYPTLELLGSFWGTVALAGDLAAAGLLHGRHRRLRRLEAVPGAAAL